MVKRAFKICQVIDIQLIFFLVHCVLLSTYQQKSKTKKICFPIRLFADETSIKNLLCLFFLFVLICFCCCCAVLCGISELSFAARKCRNRRWIFVFKISIHTRTRTSWNDFYLVPKVYFIKQKEYSYKSTERFVFTFFSFAVFLSSLFG